MLLKRNLHIMLCVFMFSHFWACLPQRPKLKTVRTVATLPRLESPPVDISPATLRANLEKIFDNDASCDNAVDSGSKSQLRLLTRDEYNRTVRDLFLLTNDFQNSIPAEQKVLGFRNNAQFALVSSDHAAAYSQTAKDISLLVVEPTQWSKLMPCAVSEGATCAQKFIDTFGTRIWRRLVTDAEKQSLLTLHQVGSDGGAAAGMQLVIRGLLSSPNFLYRSEIGRDGKLTPFEKASALSYFFWGTTPDLELLSTATSGALTDEKILLAQAQRLLGDNRAKEGIKAFADAWLGYTDVLSVNKDASKYPQFNSALRQSLSTETEDFIDYVIRQKKSGWDELMLANYSLGDQGLADFYKAQISTVDGVSKINYPDQTRKGLLGHASLLASLAHANETGPIQRGKFVREHLLCDILSPPPANLLIQPPAPRIGATTRERFAEHTSVEPCKSCHVKIDGVGFGMEDFDAIGLYQSMDNGKPVDASGQVVGLDGKTVDIKGTGELSSALAQSTRGRKCFAVQAWRMAQGRLESEEDVCNLRKLGNAFVDQNMSMAQLLIQVITDPSYSQRSR